VTDSPLYTDHVDHPAGPVGRVHDIELVGDIAYIAGDFSSVGGKPRNYLAAIDLTTGKVTDWNPSPDKEVFGLAVSPDESLIYVAGQFNDIDGVIRRKLAALDAVTGAPTAWHPIPSAKVNSVEVVGSTVYVGGAFLTVGGEDTPYLAAIDAVTGDADPSWDPSPNDGVKVIDVSPDGSKVYFGGSFTTVDGQPRLNAAAVNRSNGSLTSWDPDAPYPLLDLEVSPNSQQVYMAVGGLGSQGGNLARATSATTGATLWTKHADGDYQALAAASDRVYFGGHFSVAAGQPQYRLVAFNPSTGARDADWDPGANGPLGVWSLTYSDGLLLVGGDFDELGGLYQGHFGVFVEEGSGNRDPGADFDFTCSDLACTFDASGSGDTDGTIVDYDWDFGDGTLAGGDTPEHTFGAADTYTVTLTVEDDDGATDIATAEVTVTAPAHIHDLNPQPIDLTPKKWRAVVAISVRDAAGDRVVGATVEGFFGQGKERSCTTGSNGKCKVKVKVKDQKNRIPWTVTNIDAPGGYDPAANRDAVGGDSDGTTILVWQP
jgi:hypothetical protein